MYKTLRVLICAAILCLSQATNAQNLGNTPYSRYGLGEINQNLGNIRNAGMANTGISAGNSYQANLINPAMLTYNGYTVFDVGVTGQVKQLDNGEQTQIDGSANLSYVTLSIPISSRWSSALSLRPYSSVNYNAKTSTPLASNPEATVTEQYEGNGDISEIYFGHGVRITKGFTIGASASYLFGNITRESSSIITDEEIPYLEAEGVYYSEKTHYSGLLFRLGTNYRRKLKENLYASVGAVYSLSTDLDAERFTSYERRMLNGAILQDSILPNTAMRSVKVPTSFSAGLSVDNGSNLTVAADIAMQQWSDFKNAEGESELKNSFRIGVGAEYVPDFASVSNYFKRVTYRSGIYYGNTPYQINGEQIKDMGLTAGLTLPLSRSYDVTQLNTAFGIGQRGSTDNGLIAEKYFQFSVGVTINSRWFIKRRME